MFFCLREGKRLVGSGDRDGAIECLKMAEPNMGRGKEAFLTVSTVCVR